MGRRQADESATKQTASLVVYTSLVVLLLSFFIVMVSLAQFEERKRKSVMASVTNNFGSLLTGQRGPFKAPESTSELESDYRQIKRLALAALGEDKIRLLSGGQRKVISLESDLLFDPEQVTLKEEAGLFLQGLARIMEKSGYLVEVNGHTDDIEPDPASPARDNWELSALRALSVAKFLEAQGLSAKRLSAYGYGPLKPLRPNTTVANRALNHRVEIVLDQAAADEVGDLRSLQAPGQLHFRGFTFDLFTRPGGREGR